MRMIVWTPILLCVAAAFTAAAAFEPKDYPAVPEDVSMMADDGAPHGFIFLNQFGSPFYVYDKDDKDKSNCVDACVESWAPVKARDNARPLPDWALVARPEGYKQWSYKGRPIYISVTEVVHGNASLPKNSPWHVLVP
jgi:predicted lipoprotein with Yx(FWY)xxD motif